MSAEDHPIHLETVFFTKCSVATVPAHQPPEEGGTIFPQNNIEVRKDPGRAEAWHAVMRTVINPEADPSQPYSIEVVCHAILTADATLTDDEAKRGVMITAHSVLYGAIREVVAWLTGRQPFGPIVLGLSVLQGRKPGEARVGDAPKGAAP